MKNKKNSKIKNLKSLKHIIFWKKAIKNSKQTFVFDRALLSDYLGVSGYKKLNNYGDIQVILLLNNIAHLKTPMDVYIDVLNFIKLQKDDVLRACFIGQGESLLITKKAILGALPEIELNKYTDKKDIVKLFYSNKIVVIKTDKIKLESYKKFGNSDNYILAEQLIKRNFIDTDKKQSDFEKFLRLSTNEKNHFRAICSALGYLISSYKNP